MATTRNPRGHTAGKVPSVELIVRQAAAGAGLQFGQLLAWRVYPDRVVLIGHDGRKHIMGKTGASVTEEEAI